MKSIRVFEGEQLVNELEVPGSFGVVYNGEMGVECYDEHMEYMKYGEQWVYRREYQRRAQELVNKYSSRLTRVEPKRIAFFVDEHWELSEKNTANSQKKIDIAKASKLFALGDRFDYVVKMKQYWMERWSEAQLNAAIMSQLLRINNSDGQILHIPDDSANPLVATFGADYLKPQTVIADLLTEDVQIREFRRADGQITIDELPVRDDQSESTPEDITNRCGGCQYWDEQSTGMGICIADAADGTLADSHPSCGEYEPRQHLLEIPSDQEEDDGHDVA